MLKEQFTHWCSQLQQVTTVKRWRSLIVIAGDENWTAQHRDASLGLLLSIENQCKQRQGLVYGDVAITSHFTQLSSVNRKNYSQYLGTEQNVIVFSVQANVDNNEIDFDVDAFAALSGTLVAGGVFLLLLTATQVELFNNSQSKDYFFQRFMRQLSRTNCYLFHQNQCADNAQLPALAIEHNKAIQSASLPYGCLTPEQVLAVEAMLKV